MTPATVATLIEDGGAASAQDEFFRSPGFLAAEGVTHTLRIESAAGELLAPLVVREIGGAAGRDAASPYGYPGFKGSAAEALDPAAVDWSQTGLVSVFVRHRIDREPPLSGTTTRNEVQVADPSRPRKSRPSDRAQIRRNERSGYSVRSVDGASAGEQERSGFEAAYLETMQRAGAGERYRFSSDYFAALLDIAGCSLFIADSADAEVAAASIVARSDAMLHYYLSGTADRFLSDSPMKNVVAAIVDYAEECELPLNLGGGLAPGDALEEFKRGFANRTEPFRTSELVCDPEAYERLTGGGDSGGFFPAYRA